MFKTIKSIQEKDHYNVFKTGIVFDLSPHSLLFNHVSNISKLFLISVGSYVSVLSAAGAACAYIGRGVCATGCYDRHVSFVLYDDHRGRRT